MSLDPRQVAVVRGKAEYPARPPFHPSRAYPEGCCREIAQEENAAYDGVRECFRLAGMDAEHYGTSAWNPLAELLQPGWTVLIKPNLVKETHPRDPEGWRCVITHGSVIRAVADYVYLGLRGQGKIIVADAPQTDSSFTAMVGLLGLDALRDFYLQRGFAFELIDLRQEEWTSRDGVIMERRKLAGDPRGAVAFDLGLRSEFAGHAGEGNYYGADYDAGTVNRHHSGGRHEYLIAGSAIQADAIFSLPKLKTHKKAGITVSLKNLVGINADKNWLPHHTEGPRRRGGDEHPGGSPRHGIERSLVRRVRPLLTHVPGVGSWIHARARAMGAQVFGETENVVRSGNWYGNDTIWRMCLDLNKLVAYGNSDGSLRSADPCHRKPHYVLVDGIIAGEGRGPMNPDSVPAGMLLFGIHPPSVDATCAWLMGFDPEKIPIVRQAFRCRDFSLAEHDWPEIKLVSNREGWNGVLPSVEGTFHFRPHFGWTGQIERRGDGWMPTQTGGLATHSLEMSRG